MKDLIERLDRDIATAEKTRQEMISKDVAGWPNAVLFLIESASGVRDRLTASEAARGRLAGLLRDFLTAEYESPSHLFDCVDNHGISYQSQWLAEIIAEAEKLLANTSEAYHG